MNYTVLEKREKYIRKIELITLNEKKKVLNRRDQFEITKIKK